MKQIVRPLETLLLGCTVLTWGCGPSAGNNPGTSCTKDLECPVGEICGAADLDGNSVCETAAADATRVFGEVTVDFKGETDEKHLLAVYVVPTNEAEDARLPLISFVGDSGAAGGLSFAPRFRVPAPVSPISDDLRARIAFERQRRQRIDSLIDDLHAHRTTLAPARGRAASSCAADCGVLLCWKGSCESTAIVVAASNGLVDTPSTTASTVDITTDLVAVLEHPTVADLKVNVLIDQADGASSALAEAAATDFLATLPNELALLGLTGHAGSLDRDGDGRVTIVFSSQLEAQNAGVFDFFDFLPSSNSDATGNESDILWARVPLSGEEYHTVGTLAHEYFHLVAYAVRVDAKNDDALRESAWLDEGMAHLMEDLTGWGGSNITTVEAALDGWSDSGFALAIDSPDVTIDQEIVTRGQAYLLLRYLIDQGGATSATSTSTVQSATTLVSTMLNEDKRGFEHSAFQNAAADGFWDWLLAVYATGNADATITAAHAKDYLATGTVSGHPNGNNVVGIDTHGTFDDAKGGSTTLQGPAFTDLNTIPTDPAAPEEPIVYKSGAAFYEIWDDGGTLPAGSYTITATAPAHIDARLGLQRVH